MPQLPEIPQTPYNRHIPAEQQGESRMLRLRKGARTAWDHRPSLVELHLYTIPMVFLIGGLAVGIADETLDLHLAHKMAQVQVEPHSNVMYRVLEAAVHHVGVNAQDWEK